MSAHNNLNDDEIISGINVTPLVDVSLVLLIIFMVTATYIVAQSIPVDLPEAGTGEEVVSTFAVTITQDGGLYLDGRRVEEPELIDAIQNLQSRNSDVRVVIAADAQVLHGRVIHVIDLVRKQGVYEFAISIDEEQAR